MKLSEVAFTESVKKAQEKYGSREIYANFENRMPDQSELFHREIALIEKLDGFYMATVSEDGWPYVQFRGGPKGFLKVLDSRTLGFADFKGNMQYISTGNINATKKVALILMHYQTRTRLKIWAEVEILHPKDNPDYAEKLALEDYDADVERLFILHVKTFDWNCPQHITPKFTLEEFTKDILPKHPEIIEDCCPDLIKK